MIKLKKREKILALVFGTFVLLFLLEKLTFSPFLDKLEVINSQITAGERQLQKALHVDMQNEEILGAFESIKPYIVLGKTEEENLSVIMKKIEEMAKDSGVTLLNMKPEMGGEEIELGYRTRKVELNIEGSQRNIINFLYKVENSNYPLTITKLDFKIRDREAASMEADLNVYFLYFL